MTKIGSTLLSTNFRTKTHLKLLKFAPKLETSVIVGN